MRKVYIADLLAILGLAIGCLFVLRELMLALLWIIRYVRLGI